MKAYKITEVPVEERTSEKYACPECLGNMYEGLKLPDTSYRDWVQMPRCVDCGWESSQEENPWRYCVAKTEVYHGGLSSRGSEICQGRFPPGTPVRYITRLHNRTRARMIERAFTTNGVIVGETLSMNAVA